MSTTAPTAAPANGQESDEHRRAPRPEPSDDQAQVGKGKEGDDDKKAEEEPATDTSPPRGDG